MAFVLSIARPMNPRASREPAADQIDPDAVGNRRRALGRPALGRRFRRLAGGTAADFGARRGVPRNRARTRLRRRRERRLGRGGRFAGELLSLRTPRRNRYISPPTPGQGGQAVSGQRCPRVPYKDRSKAMNSLSYKGYVARVEFDGKVMFRISPEVHARAAI